MKILLLGEYSNVHATLSAGLRQLGHESTVLSNGDFWKNYPRDINLERTPGKLGGIAYLARLLRMLPHLKGYDIVQLINPMFLELKAQHIRPFYNYLRRNNRRIVLGAYGMDWYWVNTCSTTMPLRYSDFNIGRQLRHNADAEKERAEWTGTPKQHLNQLIANDADHIVAGLYEYLVCYKDYFPTKTSFIPYPITPISDQPCHRCGKLINIFIGISRNRSEYKGTDIMLQAARDFCARHPHVAELKVAEGVPFNEYQELMNQSDIILDQLYSYTPSMNSLLAMSKGIVVVGGGEPENYAILDEQKLRPIVNVTPSYESVYAELENLLLNPERIERMKRESIDYVRKHHDFIRVAAQYANLYEKLLRQPNL